MDSRVTHVIARMRDNLHVELAVAMLAADVGLSVSRLGALFRLDTGVSPGAYLHALRMERARLLIENTTLSVREVMQQVGLADPSHFSRDFRNAHGLSPRAYRRQWRTAGAPSRYLAPPPRRLTADLQRNAPTGPSTATSAAGTHVPSDTTKENQK